MTRKMKQFKGSQPTMGLCATEIQLFQVTCEDIQNDCFYCNP